MRMAAKLHGWTDGVTCNHAWAIVKRGSFPSAILEQKTVLDWYSKSRKCDFYIFCFFALYKIEYTFVMLAK